MYELYIRSCSQIVSVGCAQSFGVGACPGVLSIFWKPAHGRRTVEEALRHCPAVDVVVCSAVRIRQAALFALFRVTRYETSDIGAFAGRRVPLRLSAGPRRSGFTAERAFDFRQIAAGLGVLGPPDAGVLGTGIVRADAELFVGLGRCELVGANCLAIAVEDAEFRRVVELGDVQTGFFPVVGHFVHAAKGASADLGAFQKCGFGSWFSPTTNSRKFATV